MRRTLLTALLVAGGLAAAFPAQAMTPDEAAHRITEILQQYQDEHGDELLGFELHGGDQDHPPRIKSLWRNARAVVRFYHGPCHGQLKALFGLSPLPAHDANEIEVLDSPPPAASPF